MISFLSKALVLASIFLLQAAFTQTSFGYNQSKSAFTYEFSKPAIDFEDGISNNLFLGTHYLGFNAIVTPKLTIVGEMPLAHLSISSDRIGDIATTQEGNPYIGLQLKRPDFPFALEIGSHIPLVNSSELSHLIGLSSDFTERFESFAPNTLPVKILGNRVFSNASGQFIHLRIGPSVLFNLAESGEATTGDGTQVHILTALQAGIENENIRFNIGYSSRFLLSENIGFGGNELYHLAGFRGSLKFSLYEPFIIFKKPLNKDYSKLSNTIFSIGLRITQSKSSLR
ncbi:MAG: hypothetical protein ACRBF0_25075 [Calditrichia bacterium]